MFSYVYTNVIHLRLALSGSELNVERNQAAITLGLDLDLLQLAEQSNW